MHEAAALLQMQLLMATDDFASFFNQLRLAPEEMHKTGVMNPPRKGQLSAQFAIDKVLGFGIRTASNVADWHNDLPTLFDTFSVVRWTRWKKTRSSSCVMHHRTWINGASTDSKLKGVTSKRNSSSHRIDLLMLTQVVTNSPFTGLNEPSKKVHQP